MIMNQLKFVFGFFCLFAYHLNGQIGIGVESADASARLELSSSSRGFLMPRLTQTQKNSILSPNAGLMIYQTDNTTGFYYYNGNAWSGPLTSSEVDGYIKSNGTVDFSGALNLGSNQIKNLGEPSRISDIATKSYVDGFSGGLIWKESVINLVSSAPNSPSTGDRYILSGSWGGGSVNQIATFSGSSWSFTTPTSKDAVFVTVPSNGYVYNGTTWTQFNSGTVYSFTNGLSNANNTISVATAGVQTNHLANGAITAAKLNSMSATSGQLLTYSGTWGPSSISSGTVTSVSGGTGITVTNGSTTPKVSFSVLGLSQWGTNSNTGSITGNTALTFTAGGTNESITLSPSGTGYTLINGKVGLGISTPTTTLNIQNSNVYSGNPNSNSAPTLQLFNSNNTSSNAHSVAVVRTGGNSGGDPYTSFDITGVKGYTVGIENSTDRMVFNSKWNFINSSAGNKMIQFNTTGQSRVIISDEYGNVKTNWPSGWGGGLCTWDLSVSGIYYSTTSIMSDSRLKNTVNPLKSNFADDYMKLNPVSYYWNEDVFKVHQLNYGFISQEVEQIFPDLISTATDEIQTKSMNYQSLHSMNVEMVKRHENTLQEMQAQNEKQEMEMLELRNQIQQKLNK